MSSIEAKKLLTDELSNVAGDDIPKSLKPRTPHCYGTQYKQKLYNTFNVSSMIVKSDYFEINMLSPATTKFYTLNISRNGSNAKSYAFTIEYYAADRAKNKNNFGLICKAGGNPTVGVDSFSFTVFDAQKGDA